MISRIFIYDHTNHLPSCHVLKMVENWHPHTHNHVRSIHKTALNSFAITTPFTSYLLPLNNTYVCAVSERAQQPCTSTQPFLPRPFQASLFKVVHRSPAHQRQ